MKAVKAGMKPAGLVLAGDQNTAGPLCFEGFHVASSWGRGGGVEKEFEGDEKMYAGCSSSNQPPLCTSVERGAVRYIQNGSSSQQFIIFSVPPVHTLGPKCL